MSIHIRTATTADIPVIRQIAHRTWPVTFAGILTPAQLDYMLEWMYSAPSLQRQMTELDHRFLLADLDGQPAGFCAYELNYKAAPLTKIHKIYLLPETQGRGVGRALLDFVRELAVEARQKALVLNVNRENRAVDFYRHYGFSIVGTEDIDIGEGYFMNDYVMRLDL